MADINLIDVVKWYQGMPHQDKALEWLQRHVKPEVLDEFATYWREAPPVNATNEVSETERLAIGIIKEFEGLHDLRDDGLVYVYPDPLSGGKPYTVGYGTTRDREGNPLEMGMCFTVAECEEFLLDQLRQDYIPRIAQDVPDWETMTPYKQAALISFGYNLGAAFADPNTSGFSTLQAILQERRWRAVPRVLEMYRNPGTNVEKGLLRRRQAEGRLWNLGKY